MLTKDLHIWPDYHGNRSPLADPDLKGMVWCASLYLFHSFQLLYKFQISGLTLGSDFADLAVKYLATVQALAVKYPK
jgi:hypothetical protein